MKIEQFSIKQAKIAKKFLILMIGTYKDETEKVRLLQKNDCVEKLEKLKVLFPEIFEEEV
jgi:hypothetical protein